MFALIYPNDSQNIEAAEILDRLAAKARAGEIDHAVLLDYSKLPWWDETLGSTLFDLASEEVRQIGFSSKPQSPNYFWRSFIESAQLAL